MSSNPATSNGKSAIAVALMMLVAPLCAAEAQESDDGDVIDILARAPKGEIDPRRIEQCERERDAAQISREIVVCREIAEDGSDRYSSDREAAQRRYARETAYANDPQAPDVAGPGIFRGPATVGRLCIPGLQKCPPPPALMIDVTALPEAPPGSDADRIARGLPPLGSETGAAHALEEQLGLPPPPAAPPPANGEAGAVSREESAAPAEAP